MLFVASLHQVLLSLSAYCILQLLTICLLLPQRTGRVDMTSELLITIRSPALNGVWEEIRCDSLSWKLYSTTFDIYSVTASIRSWICHYSEKYYIWKRLWLRCELQKLLCKFDFHSWCCDTRSHYTLTLSVHQRSLMLCSTEPLRRNSILWWMFVRSMPHRDLIFYGSPA